MVNEIRSQSDIGAMVYNINPTTLTTAQKRWRLAYLLIKNRNNLLSIQKVHKTVCGYPISKMVATPSHTASFGIIGNSTNTNDHTEGFRSIVQRGPIDLTVCKFNGVGGLAKSLKTTLKQLATNNNHDIVRRKNAFEKLSSLIRKIPILLFFWNYGIIQVLLLYIAVGIIVPGPIEWVYDSFNILSLTYLVIVIISLTYLTGQVPLYWHIGATSISCTKTITKAQERWRKAFFSIYFSNTISKVNKKNHGYQKIISKATNYHDGHSQVFFSIDQAELTNLVRRKDLHMLQHKFNGVKSLAAALRTNLEHGIKSLDDIKRRKTVFGSNAYNKPPQKGLFYFLKEAACKDPTVFIMLLNGTLAIIGKSAKERWYESSSIFVFACAFIVASTVYNFKLGRQMHHLSKMSNDIKIEVLRVGRRLKIPTSEVVVGDVVILNVGDQVPADGLFFNGHSLLVDESMMTGISDHIEVDTNMNPFLFSGSKVVNGYAQMLVTSVGINTAWGKMMGFTTSDSNDQTPLRSCLNKLTSLVERVGLGIVFILFQLTFTRYIAGMPKYEIGNFDFQGQYMDIIEKLKPVLRTLMASAIEMPLVVTLTLSWCTNRMMGDQVMVRKLSACELMGSATVICTGKTGALTMNQMKVTKFCIGLDDIEKDSSNLVDSKILELFHQGVGLNTSGSISGTTSEYFGSSTEKALLSWAVMNLGMDIDKVNQDSTIFHLETFNSKKKRSGVSIKKREEDTIHIHWKGAAEMILGMCSHYYQKIGDIRSINPEDREHLEKIIEGMASKSLRCIAFAHKQKNDENDPTCRTLNVEGLILLGIVGIKDPCRPGAKEAIESFRSAGVKIKMITGENVFTAKAIATECGILKVGQQGGTEEVISGEEFRNYTDEERMSRVDNIRIMARSSPSDKLLMVKCLKMKGELVAFSGHDSNDAPALKEADIGLSMGIHGTEVAKESSDFVILDDSITSIANAFRWGRCLYKNIQKFVQFQLTVNIAALVINSIAVVSDTEAPLTAVQLLWVNIIMDTLGALALATEKPDTELMHNPPVGRGTSFLLNVMRRNILAQALYQIIILSTFLFRGRSFFNVSEEVKNTIIFNSFVLCHVFNLFNSRKLETKNIFEGLHKNWLFLGIIGVIVIIQVLMVEWLNSFANTEKLNRNQWGICLVVAALSWPIGWRVKFIS